LLWELWRRLPPEDVTVLTTPYPGDEEFDKRQGFRIVRAKAKWLLPTPAMVRNIDALADEVDADLVVIDPAFPLGLLPRLRHPYVLIAHGAELVIPGRLPVTRALIGSVVRRSIGVVASGRYVADAVESLVPKSDIPIQSIPPGVDTTRFRPLSQEERVAARESFGLPIAGPLIVGVSRLVPRKGFDRLVRAATILRARHPDIHIAIAGTGRHDDSLRDLIRRKGAPVTMLGRVGEGELADLYGCADIFCMPCHDRWFGLEREGFGIVFLEAAATGIPSVAGLSGGSAEAVRHMETGLIVAGRVATEDVCSALDLLISTPELCKKLGDAALVTARAEFSYDRLAEQLQSFISTSKDESK